MIVAFDPGLNGALAWVDDDLSLAAVEDMPSLAREVDPSLLVLALTHGPKISCAVVEHQQAYPRQGVSSSFKTGMGYGAVLGVLAGLRVPVFLRTSSAWKRRLHLNNDKERSRQEAIHRWPSQAELFKRKKDEGRAEAALLGVSFLLEGNGPVEPVKPRRRLTKVR